MKPLYQIACILTLGTFTLSCEKQEKPEEEVSEEVKPQHPSDWTPEDPILVKGKAIYKVECSGCHEEGEEGAPALADAEQWEKRIAKGTEKLIANAINGFVGSDGEMPARGGTPSLTDEEVASAVKFIINTPR